MDFDKLQTFYQVACVGSITNATKSLGMDKSSISRQLSGLEEQIGKKLFERHSNHLILTPHGNFLLERARMILMEVEATKAAMISGDEKMTGSLTITTTYALASTWLTHFFHRFIEQHSSLQIQIKASNRPLNLSLREADVAIRPYCNEQTNLIQKHLMTWRLHLYASKAYVKKFGLPQSLVDLDNHRLIIFGESSNNYPYNYANWPLTVGLERGKVRKPFLLINSVESMLNLIVKGVGIGCISNNSPLINDADLIPIFPEEAHQDIDAYFIYHEQFQGVSVIQSLEKFLMEYVKKHEKLPNR